MLSKRLKELREEHNKTQEEIAGLLKIARGTYTHYELGKREPDFATLEVIADIYGVSTDYLLGRTSSRNGTLHKIPEEPYDTSKFEVYARAEEELDPDELEQLKQFAAFLMEKKRKKTERP